MPQKGREEKERGRTETAVKSSYLQLMVINDVMESRKSSTEKVQKINSESKKSGTWWCKPAIPALKQPRKDHGFKSEMLTLKKKILEKPITQKSVHCETQASLRTNESLCCAAVRIGCGRKSTHFYLYKEGANKVTCVQMSKLEGEQGRKSISL